MTEIFYKDTVFAQFFIFENYVISQLKDGVVLQPEHIQQLIELANQHYAGRPFVYIANRVFSYNVSPMTYIRSVEVENLLGICIIAEKSLAITTAQFEGKFFKKEFHVCSKLDEGVMWALEIVTNACYI